MPNLIFSLTSCKSNNANSESTEGKTENIESNIEEESTDNTHEDVLVEGLHVSFMIDLVSSKLYLDGEFNNELFTGDFTQNGMTFPFEFALSEVR